MTSKLKAKEIYFKFMCIMPRPSSNYENPVERTFASAKACALYMVDETIAQIDDYLLREWWKKVKLELEKL